MKNAFNKRLKKLILWMIFVFIVLFIFRLIYGYTKKIDTNPQQTIYFEDIISGNKNYASKKFKVKADNIDQASTNIDQKYEKIAEIKTESSTFEEEETTARSIIEKHSALIQFEQKSGNQGSRKLNLLIGVPPQHFDALYNQLIKIGRIQAKQITKKDKTNEYKELNAQKQSLEKVLSSLIDLKSKGGRIDEYMNLENRILDIEQQLQALGVSLGDFDDENEFCTVHFSLLEGKELEISFLQRTKVALEWTVKMYLKLVACLFLVALVSYVLLLIIEKVRLIERIINRNDSAD